MLPSALTARPAAQAKQVAGRLCLDFANVVGGWPELAAPRDDRLTEYSDLLAWAWRAGVLDASAAAQLWREAEARPAEAAAALERARRLRGAIHAVAWHFERRRPQRRLDLDVLADEVRVARSRQRLEASAGKLEWRIGAERSALDAPLWPVALSAESYFTSGDLSRLRSCPGEDCGWHFEDTTRNRSRQWCDMADCGNLAKVRRFRSRQRPRRRGRKAL
jgi:predicted RNA-binding Zn ribbon-like protein